MTIGYRELNKVIPPLFSALPNIAILLDQLSHKLGTYHYALDLANDFFSTDIDPERQGQLVFTCEGHQWTITVLPQGYLHSPLFATDLWLKT